MKLTATEKGLLIPKELLGENRENSKLFENEEKLLLPASRKHHLFGI